MGKTGTKNGEYGKKNGAKKGSLCTKNYKEKQIIWRSCGLVLWYLLVLVSSLRSCSE